MSKRRTLARALGARYAWQVSDRPRCSTSPVLSGARGGPSLRLPSETNGFGARAMTYVLEGVMVRGDLRPIGLLTASLAQHLCLIPLDEINRSLLVSRFGEGQPSSWAGLLDLTTTIEQLAEELSDERRCIYVHAEHFGGLGFQASLGWQGGTVAFGPCLTANHPAERQTGGYRVVPQSDMAINQALRFLGVVSSSVDEIDTVGLGRHRSTSDWTE